MDRYRRLAKTFGLATVAVAASACSEPVDLEHGFRSPWGTVEVRIEAVDGPTARRVATRIEEAFERVAGWIDTDDPDSLLRAANRDAASAPVRIEEADVYRALKVAREYAERTGGAYDPTVGVLTRPAAGDPAPEDGASIAAALEHVGWRKFELLPEHRSLQLHDPSVVLDLSGIEHGFALEVAARNFALAGVSGGTVSVGADAYAWGSPRHADGWDLPVSWPTAPIVDVGAIRTRDRYLATVARGVAVREGETVVDPATGRPASSDVAAVSVLADRGSMADAVARAILVSGSLRIAEILEGEPRLEVAALVDTDGGPSVLASASLRGRLALRPEFVEAIGGRVRYLLPPASLASGRLLP